MKIVFVHPDFDKGSLVATQCQTEIDCEFVIQLNANAAITMLRILPDCKLVVVYDPENPTDSTRLLDKAKKEGIKTIALADIPKGDQIEFKDDLQYITSLILEQIKPTKEERSSEYKKIHIDHLEYFKEIPAEVSLKINDGMVKILKKGDPLTAQLINKYKVKKVKFVYLSNFDQKAFITSLSEMYKKLLSSNTNSGQAPDEIHQDVFKLLTDFGMSKETTELAKEATEQIIDAISSDESLQKQLSELYKKEANFRYKFNYMTSMIAHSLVSDSSNTWIKQQHKHAVIYASMFNDSFLESDDLVKIRSEKELTSSHNKDAVLTHALESSQRYQDFGQVPHEAIKVILQHHGSANGIGFFTNLDGIAALHPLTFFFIVAEEFSLQILTSSTKKVNVPQIIENISNTYKSKKITDVLEVLKKNLQIK